MNQPTQGAAGVAEYLKARPAFDAAGWAKKLGDEMKRLAHNFDHGDGGDSLDALCTGIDALVALAAQPVEAPVGVARLEGVEKFRAILRAHSADAGDFVKGLPVVPLDEAIRMVEHAALTPVQAGNGGRTGSPPGMLQDDSRELSRALASKPDARMHARDAADQAGSLSAGGNSEAEPHG